MALVAAVNIIGPEGELIVAGMAVPEDWPPELLESLVATGGAEEED